jgi:hypothetical protein
MDGAKAAVEGTTVSAARTMILHTCPVCARVHPVPEARAELAYGRQLTCSPDCESERRKRMRGHPFRPLASIPYEPSVSRSRVG